jgi:hypothetical protein
MPSSGVTARAGLLGQYVAAVCTKRSSTGSARADSRDRDVNGGSALYLASVCDLLGRGEIVKVDIHPVEGRPEHDRNTNEIEVACTHDKFFLTLNPNGFLKKGAE